MNTSKQQISRRSVLATSGVAAAAAAVVPSPALGAVTKKKVAILGGGMAGLSAAFELIERGYEVTVYERNQLGGKARSIPVAGTAAGGRLPLPGEHGFRFFPGFYKHVPDTMSRIPFADNKHGVKDNLVPAPVPYFPRSGGRNDAQLFGFIPDPRDLKTPEALQRLIRDEWLGGQELSPVVLRLPCAGLPVQLRRPPHGPVGEDLLVGLRRCGKALQGVPAGRRTRPDPRARRR